MKPKQAWECQKGKMRASRIGSRARVSPAAAAGVFSPTRRLLGPCPSQPGTNRASRISLRPKEPRTYLTTPSHRELRRCDSRQRDTGSLELRCQSICSGASVVKPTVEYEEPRCPSVVPIPRPCVITPSNRELRRWFSKTQAACRSICSRKSDVSAIQAYSKKNGESDSTHRQICPPSTNWINIIFFTVLFCVLTFSPYILYLL